MIQITRSSCLASVILGLIFTVTAVGQSSAQSVPIAAPKLMSSYTGQNQDGCDSVAMAPAMNSAGAYTYTQSYATSYGLIHQPTSYLSCIQPMITAADQVVNAFNGIGSIGSLNIGQLLSDLATKAAATLLQQLASNACGALNQALASSGAASGILSYLNNSPGSYPPK